MSGQPEIDMVSEQEVFKGKTLQDVFRDIYNNTDAKREQINTFVKKLVQMIVTPEDAAVIAPIIKDFLDVQVKSDEHLVRIAQIAQRIHSATVKTTSDSGILSDSEKEELLSGINKDISTIREAAERIDKVDLDVKMEELEDELSFMAG